MNQARGHGESLQHWSLLVCLQPSSVAVSLALLLSSKPTVDTRRTRCISPHSHTHTHTDYIFWKLVFVSIAVLIGYSCVDEWEECVIDKKVGKIMFMKQSLLQKLFQTNMDDKLVMEDIGDIVGATVRSQLTRYSGLAHTVDINFHSRPSIGLTCALDIGDEIEHEQVAALIRKFLALPKDSSPEVPSEEQGGAGEHEERGASDPEKKPQPEATTISAHLTSTDDDKARADVSGNSTSDESFEEIDRKELQESGEEASGKEDKEPLLVCDSEKDKNI